MELLQYWRIIRKSLWIIVLVVAIGLAGATFYTLDQHTVYQSSTTLLLNPSVPSSLVPYVQTQLASNLSDSYTQLMRTRSFGESVVKELPFPMSADAVAGALTNELESNTFFYRISVTMDTPEHAQQLLSTVLKVFLSANLDQQAQAQTSQPVASVRSEVRKRLDAKLQYLNEQITSYQTQISLLEKQAPSKDRDEQLLPLRGQLVALQQSETDALVAMAQVSDDGSRVNTAIVVDPPLPGSPLPGNMARNLALAFALALLVGIGLAFLRDYMDYTIRSPEHMEEVLQLTPLGTINILGEGNGLRSAYTARKRTRAAADLGQLSGRGLVVLEHPKSNESESFRLMRTNIQFSSVDKPVHSMVVTSAGPGEGKTFTASNLAIVIAQGDKRVILVDADLRKPRLQEVFQLENTLGFTNLVLGEGVTYYDVLQQVPGVPNLLVITSGPLPPNPSELLNSQQALSVMGNLAKHADVVIYDAPPAAAIADPIILANRVDAVVLVISAASARRDVVLRLKQRLQKLDIGNLFPVLNKIKAGDMRDEYYSYHYNEAPKRAGIPSANGHVNHKKKTPLDDLATPLAVSQRVASFETGPLGQEEE